MERGNQEMSEIVIQISGIMHPGRRSVPQGVFSSPCRQVTALSVVTSFSNKKKKKKCAK